MVSKALPFSVLHRLLTRYRLGAARNRGFTLTELLVSMVMSTIIIGTLLYVVVELLQINRREEALTQTQQNMQRAIDYVASDVSEAVFVYADPEVVADELSDAPDGDAVLAFWRLDPIDTSNLNNCAAAIAAECSALRVRQSAYTLVVYFHQTNSEDDIWEGPARIVRYELPKYTNASNLTAANLADSRRAGYSDPSLDDNFASWTSSGDTSGVKAALTDFVDLDSDSDTSPPCPDGYTGSASAPDSFYTCVVAGESDEDEDENEDPLALTVRNNQGIQIYLRGNATDGGRGAFVTFSEAGRLPTLETEVFIRGVIQKQARS